MFFTYWPDLGTTPARVNRFTGEIQISMRHMRNIPEFRRKFIEQHEKGHFLLDTRSEFEADDYAFRKLAGTQPQSLKECVKSISRVLSFRNPEHMQRLTEIIKKALEFDYKYNGNERAKDALDHLTQLTKNQKLNTFNMNSSHDNDYFEPKFGGSDNEFDDLYDNAAGRAKRQAKKTARVAKRQQKKQTRATAKATRKNVRQQRKQVRITRKQNKIANRINRPGIAVNQSVVPDAYIEDQPIMDPGYAQPEPSYSEPQYSEPVSYPVQDSEEYVESDQEEPTEEYPEDQLDENGELINPEEYYSGWDNAGGKAARQAKRAERLKLKNEKKAAKNDVIKARAEAKRTKANAKMELAKQGKSGTDWIGGAVDSIAGIFGKKKSGDDVVDEGAGDPNAEPATGKILGMPKGVVIAVIAVVVLLIIGVVIFLLKRKK